MIGMQLAYYGAAAIKVRDYTRKDTNGRATYTPIPDWGWILETVAGVLWLIIAAISACELPSQLPGQSLPAISAFCAIVCPPVPLIRNRSQNRLHASQSPGSA